MQRQRRRPWQGAASQTRVATENSNDGYLADPGEEPRPSTIQSFWTDAGRFITYTIIRRSDQAWWLTALVTGDELASAFQRALWDWMAHAPEHEPVCLGCEVVFIRRSLPTEWTMLTPLLGRPRTAMLSGICPRCRAKSDAELIAAALRDLQTMNPGMRRIDPAIKAGRT